jgi:radical SAM protein with 4Fe4S-binding SPASM domain
VLTKYNVKSAPQLVEWLASLGVDIMHLTPYGLSAYVPNADTLFPSRADVQWVRSRLEEVRARIPETDVALSGMLTYGDSADERQELWANRANCTAGRSGFIVLSDGQVILCDELPATEDFVVGNVSGQSLMEVWNSGAIESQINPSRHRFEGTACFECREFSDCHEIKGRCFRDAWKAYGSFYAPTPLCPRAPVARRM